MRIISPTLARRLAVTRQRLAGEPRPSPDADGILDVVRDLGCLQLDPTNVVARSHLLVLWSRLGTYDPAHLDALLWTEHRLFEDWAHAASIVLTEEYPVFSALKRDFGRGNSVHAMRVRDWMARNSTLRRHILTELRRNGPLPSRYFEDKAKEDWQSTGWTAGRNVDRMLEFLWAQGRIMVAERVGAQKLWDLTERCLPEWTLRESLGDYEVVYHAAQKSLRALGVARAVHIQATRFAAAIPICRLCWTIWNRGTASFACRSATGSASLSGPAPGTFMQMICLCLSGWPRATGSPAQRCCRLSTT